MLLLKTIVVDILFCILGQSSKELNFSKFKRRAVEMSGVAL
jgi:hypothetical protein